MHIDAKDGTVHCFLINCLHISQAVESNFKTYPADCRKIAAIDSNKHDWDWKISRYWKKKFLYKNIFKSDLFWWHFVDEHTSVS